MVRGRGGVWVGVRVVGGGWSKGVKWVGIGVVCGWE